MKVWKSPFFFFEKCYLKIRQDTLVHTRSAVPENLLIARVPFTGWDVKFKLTNLSYTETPTHERSPITNTNTCGLNPYKITYNSLTVRSITALNKTYMDP